MYNVHCDGIRTIERRTVDCRILGLGDPELCNPTFNGPTLILQYTVYTVHFSSCSVHCTLCRMDIEVLHHSIELYMEVIAARIPI